MSRFYVYAILRGPAQPATISGRRIEIAGSGPILAAVEQMEIARGVCRTYAAVLPARFGAILEERELVRILKSRRASLNRGLDLVEGRVQMTIRFDAPAEHTPARTRRPRSGTAYLQQRREASAAALPPVAAVITRAVDGIARAEAIEVRPGADQAVMFHLVDRSDVRRYRSMLAGVIKDHADGVVHVSGPWPPFGFGPELWP